MSRLQALIAWVLWRYPIPPRWFPVARVVRCDLGNPFCHDDQFFRCTETRYHHSHSMIP